MVQVQTDDDSLAFGNMFLAIIIINEYKYLKVRAAAIITNAPYILNVDCDHYINNSKALREAMCFMMDPQLGKKICYVQFPQRFDGIDRHDRYSNRNVVFFDVSFCFFDSLLLLTFFLSSLYHD